MKKGFLVLIAVLSLFILVGCGNDSDVPEGMQLAGGGDGEGYYFYAPESYTLAKLGEIDAVYVSKVNTTSISFTEIKEADISFPAEDKIVIKNERLSAKENFFLYGYFDSTKGEFPSDMTVTSSAIEDIFGAGDERADAATVYTYTYKYNGVSYGFIQYFAVHNSSYYVLTYSAINEVIEGFEGSRFDEHKEELMQVVSNFRFVDADKKQDEKDNAAADEYRLVTDAKLSGFEFYAPGSFTVDYSSAIVSVTAADGSNVTMTEATAVGTTADEYMKTRVKELSEIVDDIRATGGSIDPEGSDKLVGVATKLGNNSSWAFAYEYTYSYGGEVYRVYQILAVDGTALWADGFVFTYTARAENFDAHFEEVKTMIEKVVFK